MKYVWDNVDTLSVYTGGGKARQDVSFFLKKKGFLSLPYFNSKNVVLKAFYRALNFISFPFLIKKKEELLIQYPFNGGQRFILKVFKKFKKIKCIFLVHDLESLRLGTGIGVEKSDLKYADKIIALNEPMAEYITNTLQIKTVPISLLRLWDYALVESLEEVQCFDLTEPKTESVKVLITGNLDVKKASYLRDLGLIKDVHFYLLGSGGIDYSDIDNVTYLGSFDSNKPIKLIYDQKVYGLVWDGDSIETCSGLYGNYLKYNLPHKTSFYLSNQLPIIVWEGAAVHKELEFYNVSYTVKSLHEIGNIREREELFNRDLYEKVITGSFLYTSVME